MLNLNDREWNDFVLGDLFDSYTGTDLIIGKITKGEIPVISHAASNNGIACYSAVIERRQIFSHNNTISLADRGNFKAFVQKTDFYIGTRVKALVAKNVFSKKALMFIANSIDKQAVKFSYGYNACDNIDKLHIMLPTADDEQPDYAFMEQYIREREDKLKQKYIDFVNAELETPPVPLAEKTWGVFYLKELFAIIQRGKRLVREHQQAGTMPYVSSTAMNNGIDGFISTERTTREFSNCLTIANSGSVGSSFYQPSKFIASDHITHLKNDSYTMYVYLFIATMTKRMSEKYNFNREINDYRISKEKILLPTTDEGSPDYEYMEQYIKAVIFGKYKKYLEYQKCPLL